MYSTSIKKHSLPLYLFLAQNPTSNNGYATIFCNTNCNSLGKAVNQRFKESRVERSRQRADVSAPRSPFLQPLSLHGHSSIMEIVPIDYFQELIHVLYCDYYHRLISRHVNRATFWAPIFYIYGASISRFLLSVCPPTSPGRHFLSWQANFCSWSSQQQTRNASKSLQVAWLLFCCVRFNLPAYCNLKEPSDALFKLQPSPQKGWGAFATKRIERGARS